MTLPFTFDVPPQFTPMDLAAEPADRAARTARLIADAWPEATAAQRTALLSAQETLVARLREAGVRYAATVLEPAGPTTGLFTIALHPTRDHDPLTALATAVPRSATVREVDLALGRALIIAQDAALADRVVRQLQVVVHLPAEEAVAVFGIATEHLAEWETYALHLARVVRGTSRARA
ncbi:MULTISPECIES: hypothetical protein [Saccharothrix]|uniref:hypothetical protein n=1 Tax=Saccharothrix TaxID=2071 RepID=UPI00093BD050|nr:hypothetical protein [Saccharothrix sp. CB00851]OKI13885.1 hypothetical protein A6A25_16580 [Saccharothrix sp. CB00851]